MVSQYSKERMNPRYIYWFSIILILIISVSLRIKNIDRPLLDAHYFRQTQTATVTRNFYLHGIDLFHTRLDIFGEGKEQVLLLEFPLFQVVTTVTSYFLGLHDYVGRLVSLLFGIGGGVILTLLTNKLFFNKIIGLVALMFFIFNPLNYYFHQAYMIESTVIFLHLLSFYLWFKYAELRKNNLLIAASLITAIAFIHKNIYAPFLLLSIITLLFFKLGKQEFKKLHWLPAILFSTFILLIWQYYVNITNFQNGHSNFTLGDSSQQLWNFGTLKERLNMSSWLQKLTFIQNSTTKYQWPMLLIGIVLLMIKKERANLILFSWLFSMILYYLIFFRIQSHDYYFMIIMPIFNIIAAYGIVSITKLAGEKFSNKKSVMYVFTCIVSFYLFLFAYKSIHNAKYYFRIDGSMLARLNEYNTILKNTGNILFIFDEYDWNSVYTYYTKHKGRVIPAANVSVKTIIQYSEQGYKYVVIDGHIALNKIKKYNAEIFTSFSSLLSKDDLVILSI